MIGLPDRSTGPSLADPFRADRLRISPLLVYATSPVGSIRLQYNYDDADDLSGDSHSVWLGFVMRIGTHASSAHHHAGGHP